MAVTASVSGSSIQRIYVGGFQGGSGQVMEGFVGCVKVGQNIPVFVTSFNEDYPERLADWTRVSLSVAVNNDI